MPMRDIMSDLIRGGLLLIVLILAACAPGASTPTLPLETAPVKTAAPSATPLAEAAVSSAAAWEEDLQYLATRMEVVHPNLYWRVPEHEFQAAVENLRERIPGLTDQQIIVELARIAALVDGHTHLPLFQSAVDFRLYPLRLYQFSDGIFVVEADEELASLVGARLVAIGSTPIEEAYTEVADIVQHDNDMTVQLLTPVYLTIPEVLHALGIVADPLEPGFTFETPDGERLIVDSTPVEASSRDWTALFTHLAGLPQQPEPLYLSRRFEENFWYTFLEDSKTLYIQYNMVQSRTASGLTIGRMAQEIEAFVAENSVEKVVVDLRHNPGGDTNTSRPLVDLLADNQAINQPGRLFIIIGRHTFSAAALFAVDMERNTEAIFVGEPTGARPNLYGDTTPINLPNSNIRVEVSTLYWERSTPDDSREWIEPDIPTPLSAEDFFAGRDPALEAILQ